MRDAKKAIACLVLSAVLLAAAASCATLLSGTDPANVERHAAMCLDARVGLAVAEAALGAVGLDGEALRYWSAFEAGCRTAITAYCPVGATP